MIRDPGLQPERTRLAWRRTALAITVVALLTVRLALSHGRAGALVAASAGLGWMALVVLAHRRAKAMTAQRPPPADRTLALAALATVGYAALGVMLLLLSLG